MFSSSKYNDVVDSIFHVVELRDSGFIFDYVNKTYCHCNKTSLNRGRT